MVTHLVGTLAPATDAPAPVTQTSQTEEETLPTSMVTHVVGPLTPGITLVKKHIFLSSLIGDQCFFWDGYSLDKAINALLIRK